VAVTHIALRVPSLTGAEAFYRDLFGMQVILNDEIVMLRSEALTLALEAGDASSRDDGPLAHIGLHVDDAELERSQQRADSLQCKSLRVRSDLLMIWDKYGVQWELTVNMAAGCSRRQDRARMIRRLFLCCALSRIAAAGRRPVKVGTTS